MSGCGATSNDDEPAATKATFVTAADEICTQTGEEIQRKLARFSTTDGASTKRFTAIVRDVTLPALDGMYDRIAALPEPEGEAAAIDAILAAADRAIAESEADPKAVLVPVGQPTPFDDVNRLQQDFGFGVCGADEPAETG